MCTFRLRIPRGFQQLPGALRGGVVVVLRAGDQLIGGHSAVVVVAGVLGGNHLSKMPPIEDISVFDEGFVVGDVVGQCLVDQIDVGQRGIGVLTGQLQRENVGPAPTANMIADDAIREPLI